MDLNFCFSPAIELTGSNHMRYRRELIPLLITASLPLAARSTLTGTIKMVPITPSRNQDRVASAAGVLLFLRATVRLGLDPGAAVSYPVVGQLRRGATALAMLNQGALAVIQGDPTGIPQSSR